MLSSELSAQGHLVVDDEVQRPPHGVVGHLRELEGLLVDALPGQGGVPVDLHAHHLVAEEALPGMQEEESPSDCRAGHHLGFSSYAVWFKNMPPSVLSQ